MRASAGQVQYAPPPKGDTSIVYGVNMCPVAHRVLSIRSSVPSANAQTVRPPPKNANIVSTLGDKRKRKREKRKGSWQRCGKDCPQGQQQQSQEPARCRGSKNENLADGPAIEAADALSASQEQHFFVRPALPLALQQRPQAHANKEKNHDGLGCSPAAHCQGHWSSRRESRAAERWSAAGTGPRILKNTTSCV